MAEYGWDNRSMAVYQTTVMGFRIVNTAKTIFRGESPNYVLSITLGNLRDTGTKTDA